MSGALEPFCDLCVRDGRLVPTMASFEKIDAEGKSMGLAYRCQMHTTREYHPYGGYFSHLTKLLDDVPPALMETCSCTLYMYIAAARPNVLMKCVNCATERPIDLQNTSVLCDRCYSQMTLIREIVGVGNLNRLDHLFFGCACGRRFASHSGGYYFMGENPPITIEPQFDFCNLSHDDPMYITEVLPDDQLKLKCPHKGCSNETIISKNKIRVPRPL